MCIIIVLNLIYFSSKLAIYPVELVNGAVRGMDNTQSCFYKFASQFVGQQLIVAVYQMLILMNKRQHLLIAMMKFENYEHLHENIKNVLHAFRDDANFMIVCLVQWMCSQSVTNPRQSLSSDAEMLKQAFTYTQAWGSPSVLQLVDRCNKAGVVENWCMVWLNAMLKLSTSDEMLYTSELCLAAGIMSPVPYMLSFARSINEYIFEQNLDFEPKALVSARFLVHCLQLAMHAYWKQQKERQTRIVRGDCAGRKRTDLKKSRRDCCTLMPRNCKVSLATALQNAATRRIIELLLHDLLKFACLDPQTFNLDLYLPFINLCDVTSTKRALEFTCLLRKLGGF
ncbi:hypothetical protein QQG55_55285 [Brugia pahangi]